MTKEEAKTLMASIDLTADDQRSFETFQPLAGQMKQFADSGETVLTVATDVRKLDTASGKREVTELHFAPEGTEDVAPVKVILAYNSNNFYLPSGESLREVGEKNIDEAIASLAAFKVTSVEMTGTYPMRRSKAAEALGFVPTKELTSADWNTLRAKYTENDDNKGAATAPIYDARAIFEIPKINIEVDA